MKMSTTTTKEVVQMFGIPVDTIPVLLAPVMGAVYFLGRMFFG